VSPSPRKSFVKFHAGGHALSANFERPVPHQVPAQAAVFLSTVGGHGHSRVDNFEVPRLVRFRRAHSHVSGSYQDEKTATAHSSVTIEGFNILDVITADRIMARLTSEHKDGDDEGYILAIGSMFENLRIGGYKFEFKLRHELLLKNRTHKELAKSVAKGKKNGKIAASNEKVMLCSLVEEIITVPAGGRRNHVVKIPQFGTIAFAELLCQPGTKTLTICGSSWGRRTSEAGRLRNLS
jgi:hypothetical protein